MLNIDLFQCICRLVVKQSIMQYILYYMQFICILILHDMYTHLYKIQYILYSIYMYTHLYTYINDRYNVHIILYAMYIRIYTHT